MMSSVSQMLFLIWLKSETALILLNSSSAILLSLDILVPWKRLSLNLMRALKSICDSCNFQMICILDCVIPSVSIILFRKLAIKISKCEFLTVHLSFGQKGIHDVALCGWRAVLYKVCCFALQCLLVQVIKAVHVLLFIFGEFLGVAWIW